MLVQRHDSYRDDFLYVYGEKPLSRKQERTIALNEDESKIDDLYHHTRLFWWGIWSFCLLVPGLLLLGIAAGTQEFVALMWGICLSVLGLPGVTIFTEYKTRGRRYGRTLHALKDDRQKSIKLDVESRYRSCLSSTSPAMTALLDTDFGKTKLRHFILQQYIGSRKDLKDYKHYIAQNPEGKEFPVIKPLLDEYLAKTVKADILLDKAKELPPETRADSEKALKQYAESMAQKMETTVKEFETLRQVDTELEQSNVVVELEMLKTDLEIEAGHFNPLRELD